MSDLIARARTILSALVTWLLVASAVLTTIADDIAPALPAPWSERVTAIVISVLGVVSAAIAIIRRVTPVDSADRGLL